MIIRYRMLAGNLIGYHNGSLFRQHDSISSDSHIIQLIYLSRISKVIEIINIIHSW